MQWLNELPFADNRVLQIGFLAACGIAALIVLAIVYRLTFAHRLRVPGGRTRQPRLGLVDAFSLDGQRQLVLIRRDNVEHLVMIGGPNDVLVELQINRAVVPARESNQASPLLVPSTPARRTEAAALPASPAVAEPPPKVAAKVPASPPPPAAARNGPGAPAAPTVAPPIPKPPAPAQPPAPVSDQPAVPAQTSVPAQAPAPELARSASAPPAAPQAAEPARPAPANSPPPRQADPRPAQPRATMPPPIIPANASPNRGAPVRATETAPARGPGNPPAPVSCRACAAAPPGESGAGSRWLESGVNRSDGENGAARGANSDDRPAGERGLGPSAACAEDAPVRARVRLGAKSRPTPARQSTRRTPRRAASRRPKSTIPSPTSIRSRRRWRVCLAAKNPIDRGRRRYAVDSRRRRAPSIPRIALTTFPCVSAVDGPQAQPSTR